MQHPMQSKTDLYCYRFFTPTNRARRPKRLLMEKVFLQLQQQQLLSPSPFHSRSNLELNGIF